jgi:hypothetical protein
MKPREASAPVPGESTALGEEYRRLLRWYPRRWRLDNEDAMLGTLLDNAEHEGRTHPTSDERAAIIRSAFAERFGRPLAGERLRLIPLSAGALLSVFYSCFIIWSPRTQYSGALGPFSNASVITCVLLVLAFLAGLFVRGRTANAFALLAAVTEIIIGSMALARPVIGPGAWEGPSLTTVVLFTGLALLGGASFRRGRALTAASLVVAAIVAATLVASFVAAELGTFSPVSIGLAVGAGLAILLAVVLLVSDRKHPSSARNS